jgi:hypothetical protein
MKYLRTLQLGEVTSEQIEIFINYQYGKTNEAIALYTKMVRDREEQYERERITTLCKDHIAFWKLFEQFNENKVDFAKQILDEGLMGACKKARICPDDGRYTDAHLNLEDVIDPNPLQKLYLLAYQFQDTICEAT